MPNWKKLLSSGSNGSLNQLYVENSVTASAFKGDGSQLTGIIAPGTLSGSSQVDITQTTGYNTFSSSIQTYTDTKVASLVDSAPGTLDTLNELAAALNDDPNFSASIATSIGNRVLTSTFNTYSGSAHTQREALKYTDEKVKAKLNSDGVISGSYVESLPSGLVSGSSQVVLSSVNGYSTYSSSVQTYTDAKITALSSSADTHLDNKIVALSSSVDAHLDANITALSGAAHSQRVAIANTIPTNTNQLTNGAGYITSIDGALSGSSQVTISQTAGYTAFSSSIQTYTDAKVASLVDSAPATLNTLNELAAALNDDPNFSASIATSIGNRVLTSTFNTYSGSVAGSLRTEYKAGDAALSSSAHTQRVAIASSIPTNNNQLTNGAGYITSADGGNAGLLDGIDSTGFIRDLGNVTITDFDTLADGFAGSDETAVTNQPYANHNITFTFSNEASTDRKAQVFFGDTPGSMFWRAKQGIAGWHNWEKFWTDQNDGTGSGLDADTLDGLQATSLLRSDTSDTMDGTLNVTGDVVAYYSSDERLKDNLVPIGNALEKVKQLTGYEFDWNNKQDVYEGHDIGVVAQEVEKVLPEVVTTRDNGYKAVKYEKLVALLIQSNKELIERVELLEKQLNAK